MRGVPQDMMKMKKIEEYMLSNKKIAIDTIVSMIHWTKLNFNETKL